MPRRKKYRKSWYTIPIRNVDEISRVDEQAIVLNRLLGLFPEAIVFQAPAHVLDIACGTGRWALEIARSDPQPHVTGFDLDRRMIQYARALARQQKIPNVTFEVGDAREALRFSDDSFDLVHIRFCTGVITHSTWPCLLKECWRVLKKGGWCLSSEVDLQFGANLHASTYWKWYLDALDTTKRTFAPGGLIKGFFPFQESLFSDAGFVNIRTRKTDVNFSHGEAGYLILQPLVKQSFFQVMSFLTKTGVVTNKDAMRTLEEMSIEMETPSFQGVARFQQVWAQKNDHP